MILLLDTVRTANIVAPRFQDSHALKPPLSSPPCPIPATIINGTWLLQGGQPPEAFVQALREIVETVATQPMH